MPTITLKNVPPNLHRKLKDQATHNFRSLNSEILACLTQSLESGSGDVEQVIADARSARTALAAQGVWVTDADIRRARDEGRP